MSARATGRGNGADSEHQNDAAEQALLGALLIGGIEGWGAIKATITQVDFARPDHRLIFAAIAELAAQGLAHDIVTVANQLERGGKLDDAGGVAYLGTLAGDTPSAENIASYAGLVLEGSRRRRVQKLGADIVDAFRRGESSVGMLTRLNAFTGNVSPSPVEPLAIAPVSTWSDRAAPAARDWVLEKLIPARRVTSFLANGGDGKTTIAVQMGVHIAINRALYGLAVNGGPVLGLFCEDEEDELHRRISAACSAEGLELEQLDSLVAISRDGHDNLLCTFEREQIVLTEFYRRLDATVAAIRPRLLILDTLADFFGGDYLSTPHARQFVKTALGGLCVRHGCAVLLVAHPSAAGMNSGDGAGFSTAWHNSVRSRLYLRRPHADEPDRRVLEVKKANYGPSGLSIPLIWQTGVFVPDGEPQEQAASASSRAPRADTRLAMAVMSYMRNSAPGGAVVAFKSIVESLDASGELPKGEYETVRKQIQRTLRALDQEGLIHQTQVPRGSYRLVIQPSMEGVQ